MSQLTSYVVSSRGQSNQEDRSSGEKIQRHDGGALGHSRGVNSLQLSSSTSQSLLLCTSRVLPNPCI